MTLDDYIANYLRDAQGRIAELSVEMALYKDKGSYDYLSLYRSRLELAEFMDILYEGNWLIKDGYTHLQVGEPRPDGGWSPNEVISEIEYLRYIHGVDEAPYINFTAHYPKIVSTIVGGGTGSAASLPAGVRGQFIGYNISNEPIALDFDPWGGHRDSESINQYFQGRV